MAIVFGAFASFGQKDFKTAGGLLVGQPYGLRPAGDRRGRQDRVQQPDAA